MDTTNRETGWTFVALCDEDGMKCPAALATHYLANDADGSTHIFEIRGSK